MNYETLRLIRNMLLRGFVIGVVFALLLGCVVMFGWSTWTGLATQWFHADEAIVIRLVFGFFLNIRFFLLFIVLTPALAIHWTLKAERNLRK